LLSDAIQVLVSLNTAIPVRFNQDTTDRLKSVSVNTGIPVAQLVRIATENYLKEIEASRSVTVSLRETPPLAGKSAKSPARRPGKITRASSAMSHAIGVLTGKGTS
jgi:predicted DNA-binding protein